MGEKKVRRLMLGEKHVEVLNEGREILKNLTEESPVLKFKYFGKELKGIVNYIRSAKTMNLNEIDILCLASFFFMIMYGTEKTSRRNAITYFYHLPTDKKKQHMVSDYKYNIENMGKLYFKPITHMRYLMLQKAKFMDNDDFKVKEEYTQIIYDTFKKDREATLDRIYHSMDVFKTDLTLGYNAVFGLFLLLFLNEMEEAEKFYKCISDMKMKKAFDREVYFAFDSVLSIIGKGIGEEIKIEFDKGQSPDVIEEYNEMIRTLSKELKEAKAKIEEYEEENNRLKVENDILKNKKPLDGVKVLVIGSTGRKEVYQKVIESKGAFFDFIDGIDDARKFEKATAKADITFHVTTYSKHKGSNQLKGYDNIIPVNNDGIRSFREVVENYIISREKK